MGIQRESNEFLARAMVDTLDYGNQTMYDPTEVIRECARRLLEMAANKTPSTQEAIMRRHAEMLRGGILSVNEVRVFNGYSPLDHPDFQGRFIP